MRTKITQFIWHSEHWIRGNSIQVKNICPEPQLLNITLRLLFVTLSFLWYLYRHSVLNMLSQCSRENIKYAAFISCGSCIKWLCMWCLQTTDCFFTVLVARGQKSMCLSWNPDDLRSTLPPEVLGNAFFASFSFWWLTAFLGFSPHHSSFCFFAISADVSVKFLSASLIRTLMTAFILELTKVIQVNLLIYRFLT